MKFLKIFILSICVSVGVSCNYLDIIPDDTPTIDHAFTDRYQALGYLHGCYSYLPQFALPAYNPAFLGCDEVWAYSTSIGMWKNMWDIAIGLQNATNPMGNYWSSRGSNTNNYASPLWTAISDCNIFLANIHKPIDLTEIERNRWIAEVKFLKAYYHFYLFRMYGPIPLMDTNFEVSDDPDKVRTYREPVDVVVKYISDLLDEAANTPELPDYIINRGQEMGRITRPIVLALKAQLLTYAASPLFNGNPDFASLEDNRGVKLFPQSYDPNKWVLAAEALKAAIQSAEDNDHRLFDFVQDTPYGRSGSLNEKTILSNQVRGAVVERWNPELIWGDGRNNTAEIQKNCMAPCTEPQTNDFHKSFAPTLNVLEQFYTSNGVPMDEDVDWQTINKYDLGVSPQDHEYYIRPGKTMPLSHFNREPRFYGAVWFNDQTYYGNENMMDLFKDTPASSALLSSIYVTGGKIDMHSATAYACKKLIHFKTSANAGDHSIRTSYGYAFPIIRLADLYLMYAEALNEVKPAPDQEVYYYIDEVRKRSGLKGVVESWQTKSIYPDKPKTQQGMREIIRQERMIELAFEGIRFWDLRRWKLAEVYMNKPIRGYNYLGTSPEKVYEVQELFQPTFTVKDYFWPIRQYDLDRNENLVQNIGW